MELAMFLPHAISGFARNERRRRENKLEGIDLRQLGLQRFEAIDRKTRSSYPQLGPGLNHLLQVIAEETIDIIEDFHRLIYRPRGVARTTVGAEASLYAGRYQNYSIPISQAVDHYY